LHPGLLDIIYKIRPVGSESKDFLQILKFRMKSKSRDVSAQTSMVLRRCRAFCR